jgi:hypothetical protein
MNGQIAMKVDAPEGRLDRIVLRLLHWWRLAAEPDSALMTGVGRWRVRYAPCRELPAGGVSSGMSYRQACSYAEMFDGAVERVPQNDGLSGGEPKAKPSRLNP